MEFRTIVQLPESSLKLTPDSKVLLIGSCFTDHIGKHLSESLPEGNTEINPNGVLYNPGSIFIALRNLLDAEKPIPDSTFFKGQDGLWKNWWYSGEFAADTRETCATGIATRRQAAAQLLQEADALFVTLSTDHCYFLSPDCSRDSLVANCHKQPARCFTEAPLPFASMLEEGNQLLQELSETRPQLKVIFTLSPYRYAKYGLHESQVSKARLLHAIDEWCQHHGNALYFPAYEIVIDELRDYRFYATDMLHPSEQAVDYVWEQFVKWAFTSELKTFAKEKAALLRDFAHRPLHPQSETAQLFFEQREKKKENFIHKWGKC